MQGNVNVVHHYIGDDLDDCVDDFSFSGAIRTVVDVDNDSVAGTSEELHSILIDSGADASIFPAYLLGKGQQVVDSVGKLCDAQGVEIPIAAVQDMEIRLKDLTGRTILLRERVAVSDKVGQPILCFCHLLESGWGIDATQQTLTHAIAGAHVPLEMQNKWWFRVPSECFNFVMSMMIPCVSGQFKLKLKIALHMALLAGSLMSVDAVLAGITLTGFKIHQW